MSPTSEAFVPPFVLPGRVDSQRCGFFDVKAALGVESAGRPSEFDSVGSGELAYVRCVADGLEVGEHVYWCANVRSAVMA